MRRWAAIFLVGIGWGWGVLGQNNPCVPGATPTDGCPYLLGADCSWICDAGHDEFCCREIIAGEVVCSIKSIEECCGDCENGSCIPGTGTPHGSGRNISFQFSLGKMVGSLRTAGHLSVKVLGPRGDAASSERLSLLSDAKAEVSAVVMNHKIRRVIAPEAGVSIVSDGMFAYELRFYSKGILESAGEAEPMLPPFTVWRVFDPDNGTNANTRLTFEQRTAGQLGQRVEFEWTSSTSLVWRSGGDLRTDEVSWTSPLAPPPAPGTTAARVKANRVDTHLVRNPDGSVAERTVQFFRTLNCGDKLVLEQKGAEGEEITTAEIEYFDDFAHRGRFGKISKKIHADGRWSRFDYDLEGRKVLEVTPWLDGAPDAPDGESVVTMWDYTCVDDREIPRRKDRRWRTQLRLIAGQWAATCYRTYFHEYGEHVLIEEEASAEAATYGDASNRRSTQRSKSDLSDVRVRHKPVAMLHPDGTEDSWQYRELPNSGFIEVTETLRANQLMPFKSTRTVSILDSFGREIQSDTFVLTASNQWERLDGQTITRDEFGRELVRRFDNGLFTETTWNCCGKESETRPDGQRESFVADALGRTILSIHEDGPTNRIAYDAAGNILSKTRFAGGFALTSSNRYDLAGRLIESRDTAGLVTTIEYGERSETVIRPGGATEITTRLRDGKIKSLTGTAVLPVFFKYGIAPDGAQWTKTHTGSTNSPQWTLSVRNREGRSSRTERPGFGGTVITNSYDYDTESRLIRERQTGALEQLFQYDERGDLFRSGTDVDSNGTLDLASMDRIQESRSEYVFLNNIWFLQQMAILYPYDNSANVFTTSVTRTQIGGRDCSCEAGLVESLDPRGNLTTRQTAVEPHDKRVTTTIIRAGIANAEIAVTRNGLLESRTLPNGAQTRFIYDDLGRLTQEIDSRLGTNRVFYLENGWPHATEDAAGFRTTFDYDPATGRRISTTDAISNTIYTAYDLQGRVTNTWGATYPIAYEYDAHGRMTAMKTWRDLTAAPDTTSWLYDAATGLLLQKLYADNNGPTYNYDPTGRLTQRTWARGIETDYTNNPLGQLTTITYSDLDTPNVTFTYNRMGQQTTVTDVQGTRTNIYNATALLEEQFPNGEVLTRSYDTLGRPTGLTLGTNYTVNYTYDPYSRLATVAQFNYTYLENSDLIASVSNGEMVAMYDYESHRNLRTKIENRWGTNLVSSFAYTHDAVGRRTARVDSEATTNVFSYNLRSELVTAIMGINSFGYAYDPIGNRQMSFTSTASNFYEANQLNQYSTISNSLQPSITTLQYDLDGNLAADENWNYTWDAENRLIGVAPAATKADSIRMTCAYDYMSRRVKKDIETYDGASWSNTLTMFYTYDGWNLICENRRNSPKNSYYVWGLDLSSTLQGAGGVGGLLAQILNNSEPLYYAYDANGNVTDVVDTNGIIVAHYKYDSFGNTLAKSSAQADVNPFRFSTKYWDNEIGHYYYGYRFYLPKFGRWPNRDPIGEAGGKNLYWFVGNHPTGSFDMDGRMKVSSCEAVLKTALERNAKAKKLLKELKGRKCPAPKPTCICCSDPQKGGWFDLQTKEITICANAWSSGAGIISTVVHELTHALDDCKGTNWSHCKERACSEIRAYDQGGTCASGGLDRLPGESYRECVKRKATRSTTVDPSCTEADVESQMGVCFGSDL